ncbi:MAG: ATP-binding protein [Candidatus Bathyarchaeia archaeon]|nr:ATP-binding protein [Candidatus Bathyarchaeota archaeon]
MSAVQELEQIALKYAEQAVMLDRQGKKEMAIEAYQKAIDSLLKIAKLNPSYELNRIYLQRAEAYKRRVAALKSSLYLSPATAEDSSEGRTHFEDLIIKEPPKVAWEDVVGLEDAKRAIREAIVYPSLRPDLFPLGWPRGILLFGPPGCGKTLLAAAVANEISAKFIPVDAASIMSKWLGEAEQNVARLFNLARREAKNSPVIIFIDEIDSLIGTRRFEVGGEIRVKNQFLKEMDGIIDKKNPLRVYVIGATNKPWDLDPPFIRRFQKRIYVPPPDYKQRLETFRLYTKPLKLAPDVDLDRLARLTEGFSGSDIMDICQSVQLKVNSEIFENCVDYSKAEPRAISMNDFLEVLKMRKPSITKEMIAQYERWFNEFKAL